MLICNNRYNMESLQRATNVRVQNAASVGPFGYCKLSITHDPTVWKFGRKYVESNCEGNQRAQSSSQAIVWWRGCGLPDAIVGAGTKSGVSTKKGDSDNSTVRISKLAWLEKYIAALQSYPRLVGQCLNLHYVTTHISL